MQSPVMAYLFELADIWKMSQKDIAIACKADPQTVSRWRTGRNMPMATTLSLLTEVVHGNPLHVQWLQTDPLATCALARFLALRWAGGNDDESLADVMVLVNDTNYRRKWGNPWEKAGA